MTFNDLLTSILLPALVSGGTAIGAIKYLSKKLIEHRLAKDMATFKSELTERTESLKTQLSIYAHEQNIVLSRIDSQRADAIRNVYSALVKWSRPVSQILAGSPYVDASEDMDLAFYGKRAEEAHSAGKVLSEILVENAIYFAPEVYERISKTVLTSTTATAHFLRPIRRGEAEEEDLQVLFKQVEQHRVALKKIYVEEILPLHQEVTNEFRALIGAIRNN